MSVRHLLHQDRKHRQVCHPCQKDRGSVPGLVQMHPSQHCQALQPNPGPLNHRWNRSDAYNVAGRDSTEDRLQRSQAGRGRSNGQLFPAGLPVDGRAGGEADQAGNPDRFVQ
uniref:(northern house mosquito) hypothetical protein n=1 Tax=Culex pipiens TaxID=7175 RepID=A0A8D8GFA4_CULPI